MFDHETVYLMARALAICLVLTGIHGYLGIHVLERKVIFVDLAMAQIAALGATVAIFLGYNLEQHPGTVYVFSLGFTLAGAAVFSLTRMRHEKVPHEAFIGIVYAVASALAILVLARSTSAGETLRSMLVGNILLAKWSDVARTAAIYGGIGAFHWIFRERFFRLSVDHEGAIKDGLNVRLWDFLFYATFGVVITSSVAIAGVLLVFCFLVVPSVIGVLFAESRARRLAVAWGAGTLVSVLGIGFTFQQGDLPAGPVVVAAFALTLVAAGLARHVLRAPARGPALLRVAGGAAAVAALAGGLWLARNRDAEHPAEHEHASEFQALVQELRSPDENVQLHAIDHFLAEPDPHAVEPLLDLLRRATSGRVLEHLASTLQKLDDARAAPPLLDAARRPGLDPALRLALAEASLGLRHAGGLGVLLDVADAGPRLTQARALRLFEKLTGRSAKDVAAARTWWTEHGSHIRWRDATGRFE